MAEEVPELAKKEFDNLLKEGLVLIDFFAEWCMPCLMMAPVIEELADKFERRIKFGKVNVEENPELAQKYNVVSIPNFVLFKDGKKIEQFTGTIPEEEFAERLEKLAQ